jgi:hypothetical protein
MQMKTVCRKVSVTFTSFLVTEAFVVSSVYLSFLMDAQEGIIINAFLWVHKERQKQTLMQLLLWL